MTDPARLPGSLDEPPPCDCRANDWVEGDNGAIRCVQCGGYAGEPGTSIRVVPVAPGSLDEQDTPPRENLGGLASEPRGTGTESQP